MPTKFLGRFFWLFAAVLAANCAWAEEAPAIASLGDNTYSLTVKAGNKFTRNTQKLRDQAVAAATRFCAKDGKQLKVVSVKEDKSLYLVGPYAQVTLTFKALSPGDRELTAVTEDPPKPTAPITVDLLTSELTKLDDLRKKGLLTDEEFTVAKKKLLDRL